MDAYEIYDASLLTKKELVDGILKREPHTKSRSALMRLNRYQLLVKYTGFSDLFS